MDEFHFELAAIVEQAEREEGIYAARKGLVAHRPADFHGECGCGEAIPDARVNLGYFNCVDCARSEELARNPTFLRVVD